MCARREERSERVRERRQKAEKWEQIQGEEFGTRRERESKREQK